MDRDAHPNADRDTHNARCSNPDRDTRAGEGGLVKPQRSSVRLTEEQQMILGLVLVVLLAISMLYCLGFASLLLRETWQDALPSWNDTSLPEEIMEQTLTPIIEPTDALPMLR